ncbi:MAG: hypothetical protein HXX14_10520 [Bacteroidetes bacterium]|nr:hypothetical protein [Bacteroidota bacterium]
MKKIVLFTLFSLFLISCKKEHNIPANQVPDWLKSDISKQEQLIKDSPKLMNAYGAWLRYEWKNEYYFEYHNDLSSSSPLAISMKGDTLRIWANDINTDYSKEKCCKVYVWKAPKARDY